MVILSRCHRKRDGLALLTNKNNDQDSGIRAKTHTSVRMIDNFDDRLPWLQDLR